MTKSAETDGSAIASSTASRPDTAGTGAPGVFGRFVLWCHRRDEVVRVSIVAAIGIVSAWITYEIVYMLNGIEPRATVSWGIAFVIGIFRQHHLHRVLSFPRNALSYLATLKRDFVASFGIALLSTLLIYLLTEQFDFHYRSAWVGCVVFVALFEYLVLKVFVFPQRRAGRGRHL